MKKTQLVLTLLDFGNLKETQIKSEEAKLNVEPLLASCGFIRSDCGEPVSLLTHPYIHRSSLTRC